MNLKSILHNLPEVKHPVDKKLSFNQKAKWTIIILAAFFVLANIPLYGLADIGNLWRLLLLTFFGVVTGLGVALTISSLIDMKWKRS